MGGTELEAFQRRISGDTAIGTKSSDVGLTVGVFIGRL